MEARHLGLLMDELELEPRKRQVVRTESLRGPWRILEWLFIKRLSYQNKTHTAVRCVFSSNYEFTSFNWFFRVSPHRGQGRTIVDGQKIHESVLDELNRGNYIPHAHLPHHGSWKDNELLAKLVEPWAELGDVARYKEALGHEERRQILDKFHHSARTGKQSYVRVADSGSSVFIESGKKALLQAGVRHALEELPVSDTGELHISDLHKIRVIFDEVYLGRVPEKLSYQEVKPLLSHILTRGRPRDYDFARTFLADFTDLAPSEFC